MRNLWKPWTLALVTLVVGIEWGRALEHRPVVAEANADTVPPLPSTKSPPPLPDDLSPEEKRDIEIFRRASGSVVNITTEQVQRDLFSMNVYEVPQGTGSGFVWDSSGDIVTNFHVVQHGDAFSVTLADGSTLNASLVGTAPDKDLAVLHVKTTPDHLPALQVGQSHDLLVGQRVLAVGNPFGLDHSLTVGVVSALGRQLESPGGRTIHDVIQTDAAINPGNSGGPLLDSRGRLVGVNSAIFSPSGANAGIGFAIPVDTVKRLVPQMIKSGHPVEPGIGISLLPDAYAAELGLQGAIIYRVDRNSEAEKAGLIGIHRDRQRDLVLGDRIISVDGKPVKSADDLFSAFEVAGVGTKVSLTLVRGRAQRDVMLTLSESP
jgi:S1-C subfamily serine protease